MRVARLLLAAALLAPAALAQSSQATLRVHFDQVTGKIEAGKMALGQGGLSKDAMWEGRDEEIRALRPRLIRLFIQEYFNLLPARGQYHFDTLDRSVDLILKSGAEPLMNIDFKPTVLYPTIDHDIVEPNDWGEWERLIEAMVRHYKERGAGIRYWEISNEPDLGESGGCPYRFTPENYTPYYQKTAAAIRRAGPDAKVGGPALAGWESPILPALLDFCQRGQAPLDFVSWHGYTNDPTFYRKSTEAVKRMIAARPALHPETFIDEWNIALMKPREDNLVFQAAYVLEAVWNMLEAGLDYSCYYHIRDYHVDPASFARFMSPKGVAFMASWWNRWPQYHGLFDFEDHIRPAYYSFKLLTRINGDRLRVDTTNPAVHALAAYDPEYRMYSVLLWNFSEQTMSTKLEFDKMPRAAKVNRLMLDARSLNPDDSSRLHFLAPENLSPTDNGREIELKPYGIEVWFFSKE